jgi:drug/metabolite transporter (DMT)-like permease
VQPVAYFLCESYGISLTNSVLSGVIIALVPIVALIFGVIFLSEKPRRAQVGYCALSIVGVIAMTLQQSSGGDIHPIGVVLLFGAVLTGVLFNIISRKTADTFSALERTYVMMLVAAVCFTALAMLECRGNMIWMLAPLTSGRFLGAMLYLSLASSIMAFLLLNFANGELPVGKVTAFCNLTTVISVFAGVVFLGEPFTVISLIASVVIIVGVWGVQKA